MKLKKRIIPMLAVLLAATAMTTTASAHDGDYYGGKYIGKDGADILLRICESAQTSLLTKSGVYEGCYDWNNISSSVTVRMAWTVPGMPSLKDEMLVVGMDLSNTDYLAVTVYYRNGASVYGNSDWDTSKIYMSTALSDFQNGSCRDAKEAARQTFVHEVGHALKLSHPLLSKGLPGHTKPGGRPVAVMNQGYPGSYDEAVSPIITAHDKSCLIAKWGA